MSGSLSPLYILFVSTYIVPCIRIYRVLRMERCLSFQRRPRDGDRKPHSCRCSCNHINIPNLSKHPDSPITSLKPTHAGPSMLCPQPDPRPSCSPFPKCLITCKPPLQQEAHQNQKPENKEIASPMQDLRWQSETKTEKLVCIQIPKADKMATHFPFPLPSATPDFPQKICRHDSAEGGVEV